MAEVGEGLWAKALEVEGRWGWRVEAPARASQGPRWSLCACGGGGRHSGQGGVPPWVVGRGHQDPDPSDTPKALRGWRSPHLKTHPSRV